MVHPKTGRPLLYLYNLLESHFLLFPWSNAISVYAGDIHLILFFICTMIRGVKCKQHQSAAALYLYFTEFLLVTLVPIPGPLTKIVGDLPPSQSRRGAGLGKPEPQGQCEGM